MAKENSGVTKVTAGGKAANKEEKQKGRKDFPIKEAMYRNAEKNIVTAVNGDNLLIAVPKPLKDDKGQIVYAGYSVQKHLPLKKEDFASLAQYMYHQGFVSRLKAITMVKRAEEFEAKAAHILKFGDEVTRKKVAKVAKMKSQLETLQKQLQEEGVNLDDI